MVTPTIASAMARGTVRSVSRTSPLGISATSIPANAKIEDERHAREVAGRRPFGDLKVLGAHEKQARDRDQQERQQFRHRDRGVEPHAQRHAAHVDPRPEPERDDEHSGRASALPDNAGTSSPMLAANTDDTAAVANMPSIHSSTPEMNPA